MEGRKKILEIKNVTKLFPGVKALSDVSFDVYEGESHVILGENGAGKSTLIKIITGAYPIDEGDVLYLGESLKDKTVRECMNLGIGCIYQELLLFPDLSVKENIFIGNEPVNKQGAIDWPLVEQKSRDVLKSIGLDIDPNVPLNELGTGQQQLVEIAKSLVKNIKLIIMDEPTSSLSSKEIQILYDVVERLKEQNITIIFISHKLDEVMKIGDRISILKDGVLTGTLDKVNTNPDELVSKMVGRSFKTLFPKNNATVGEEAFRIQDFNSPGVFENINLHVRTGEVVGLYGVVGAGRTEVARAIYGLDKSSTGKIYINSKETVISNPTDAVRKKLAFLTENRKEEGLVLENSVEFNVNLASLYQIPKTVLNLKDLDDFAVEKVKELNIKTPNTEALCLNLSGGNQQKVVIAKWLLTDPDVLIIDEPTRGIDVGAKMEVYQLINTLVEKGRAVLMISSELQEVVRVCDRVYVMRDGQIVNCFKDDEITEENIVRASIGG
ncbi:MAG: sugar ABC transporter ATP-binding protein [Sphaerochaetaceae bacterium]|jgi:ribose transport system ATP-binding protein